MELRHAVYGRLDGGQEIDHYTIANRNGISVQLLSFGATLSSVRTLDVHGRIEEITLGFDNLASYAGQHPYFGSTVGRVANRIAGGRFTLEEKEYVLFCNDGKNHLHGGKRGYDHVSWESSPWSKEGSAGVRFTYHSPDGEEGYPGNLVAHVSYTLDDRDWLEIAYEATADKPTPVNLANHAYWNLKGAGSGDVTDHLITLYAEEYLPTDEGLIPTGELRKVAGGPFDFRSEHAIGESLQKAGGYDHCFVIKSRGPGPKRTARVYEPTTGRGMEMLTTQPGVQFYTGNYLNGIAGRDGKLFGKHGAFCLETQDFPNAVNLPAFPNTILRPGQTYQHLTRIHFFCQ